MKETERGCGEDLMPSAVRAKSLSALALVGLFVDSSAVAARERARTFAHRTSSDRRQLSNKVCRMQNCNLNLLCVFALSRRCVYFISIKSFLFRSFAAKESIWINKINKFIFIRSDIACWRGTRAIVAARSAGHLPLPRRARIFHFYYFFASSQRILDIDFLWPLCIVQFLSLIVDRRLAGTHWRTVAPNRSATAAAAASFASIFILLCEMSDIKKSQIGQMQFCWKS